MLRFVVENRRWLGAGFLLAYASAPGQAWFISLFAGEIRAAYGLTDGQWGALFSGATLTSAALLFWRGSLADSLPLDRLGPAAALALAGAAALFAIGGPVATLAAAVFLLRFCGQSLFGLIAMTAVARWFVSTRGRAVAVVGLGYSVAEVTLPLPALLAVGWLGWQGVWAGLALILALVVAPVLRVLLASDRAPAGTVTTGAPGLGGRHWTRGDVLGHWLFPALLPLMLTTPLVGTVLFFHQVHVAEIKGWSLVAMAPGYAAYASGTVLASFLAGIAADRFGPDRLLPVMPLPVALALAVLGPASQPAEWVLVLGLFGTTQGIANALWGSLLPGVYGTRHVASVRSMVSAAMVVSTGVGPGMTGLVIDAGMPFPVQAGAIAVWALLLVPAALAVRRRLVREMRAAGGVPPGPG